MSDDIRGVAGIGSNSTLVVLVSAHHNVAIHTPTGTPATGEREKAAAWNTTSSSTTLNRIGVKYSYQIQMDMYGR